MITSMTINIKSQVQVFSVNVFFKIITDPPYNDWQQEDRHHCLNHHHIRRHLPPYNPTFMYVQYKVQDDELTLWTVL